MHKSAKCSCRPKQNQAEWLVFEIYEIFW